VSVLLEFACPPAIGHFPLTCPSLSLISQSQSPMGRRRRGRLTACCVITAFPFPSARPILRFEAFTLLRVHCETLHRPAPPCPRPTTAYTPAHGTRSAVFPFPTSFKIHFFSRGTGPTTRHPPTARVVTLCDPPENVSDRISYWAAFSVPILPRSLFRRRTETISSIPRLRPLSTPRFEIPPQNFPFLAHYFKRRRLNA